MSSQNNTMLQSVLAGLAIAIVIGAAVWVIEASPSSIPERGVKLSAGDPASNPVYVEVKQGDTADVIGKRLAAGGVIENAESFHRLAEITGTERNLAAGEYEFLPGTSVLDTLTRINDGLTSARVVAVPEGMRLEQIAELLQKRGVVSAGDFLAAANSIATSGTDLDADLLSSRPRSATLEGYFFPATYSFKRNVTANEAVLMMLNAESERFTPELRAEARAQGLSVHDVLILASIVERETVVSEERPLIASVYRNRMKAGMLLQADPTVQYEFGYWKLSLSIQDLQFDSTYNTYLKTGLPPGPIASPGLDSIIAVIRPAQTTYLFFVARNDGTHAFSETYEQHQQNVARYQP
jgi:UPF0755 protein